MAIKHPFNHWVTCPFPRLQPSVRLFCFPYAGGGASIFRSWATGLPEDIEVCPIQLSGRENRWREPPDDTLELIVSALAHALYPFINLPFAFWGHSMGALIAYELTRYFQKLHYPLPACLFVSGHRAPQCPSRHDPIHQLPESEFIEKLIQFGGTPKQVLREQELLKFLMPTLRADFSATERHNYQHSPPLNCSISALGGTDDPYVNQDELMAWEIHTRGEFKCRTLPGDHFFIRETHNKEQLLRFICDDLMIHYTK